MVKKETKKEAGLPQKIFVFLISLYQKTLSPDHSPFSKVFPDGYCRFYPTCSEYGKKAILKYGVLKGGVLSFWRVLRCNPWSKGGYDPLK